MPLHLLHHKSYHVYNAANIARVRADEVAAAAEEQAQKDREATDRAAARIALLRGEQPAAPPAKIEDDLNPESAALIQVQPSPPSTSAVTHISTTDLLFPAAAGEAADPSRPPPRPTPRQREAAREAAAVKREEDLHRLGGPSVPAPWYTSAKEPGQDEPEIWQEKRRRDREVRRKEWNDPLLAVKQAVREAKEVEKERERWRRQREAEVGGLTPVVEREKSPQRKRGYERRARERSRDNRGWRYDEDEDERDSDGERKKKARSRRRSRSRSPRTSKDKKPRYRSRSRSRNRDRSRRSRHHHEREHRKARRHHTHDEDPELARLRKEREQREKAERERAEALLRAEEEAKRPGWKPAQKGGRYSAQFATS